MNKPEDLTEAQLEAFMRASVMDDDILCPFCGTEVYEADYVACDECNRPNPFKVLGLV